MTQPTKPTPEPMPACIRCHRSKHVRDTNDPHVFWCAACDVLFDPTDDGDIGKGYKSRPDVVAERREARQAQEEAYRQRQLARLQTRFQPRKRGAR